MAKTLAIKDDHCELFMEALRDLGFTMVETRAIMKAHEDAKLIAMAKWLMVDEPDERKLRKKKRV